MHLPDIKQLAGLIRAAGQQELLSRFTRVERGVKMDGSFLTEADLAVQQCLQQQLQQHWPAIAFLGEEMSAEQQAELLAHNDNGLWILDPLDGTSNYATGIPYFAVSLGLMMQGEMQLAVVYDPQRDECFTAIRGQGAWMNGQLLSPIKAGVTLKQATALIDFKRLSPELAQRLAMQPPYSSQRSFGSVALDWCWLAMGRSHVYLHGASNLWDYGAGHLIFTEAGGQACTLAGEAIPVARLEKRSSVGALDETLFRDWCDWLGIEK